MQLRVLSLTAAVLLSACGGGGSGGTASSPSSGASAAAITAANYEDVARASFSAANFALGLSNVSDAFTPTGAPRGPLSLLRFEPMRRIAAAGSRPLATTNNEQRCSGGGLIRLAINDANNNSQLDAGDTLAVDFLDCLEDGERRNGQFLVTVRSSTSTAAHMDMRITNLRFLQSDGSTSGGDGTMSVMVSTTNGVVTSRLEVQQLVTHHTPAGKPTQTQTLSAFLAEAVTQTRLAPQRTSITMSGQLSSSQLGSSPLSLSTDPSFTLVGSDDYPFSGQMRVRTVGGSQLRLVALNNQQVRVELDANGDGTFESSVTKQWHELD